MAARDVRSTRAWRKLRDKVIEEEPECQLRFPDCCTKISTRADHILTVKKRPDLALERSNLRGACDPCNRLRGQMPDELLMPSVQRPRALDIFTPLAELPAVDS